MMFADLLPAPRVRQMLGAYITQTEEKLSQIRQAAEAPKSEGERFVRDFGETVYVAMLDFLRARRAEIETQTARAAE